MAERREEERKKVDSQNGSEKVRPDNEKDFAGIEKAKSSPDAPKRNATQEWQAREDEGPTP